MGTFHNAEVLITECLVCKNKDLLYFQNSSEGDNVLAYEFSCNNCSKPFYFILIESEIDVVRDFPQKFKECIQLSLSNSQKEFVNAHGRNRGRKSVTYGNLCEILSKENLI